MYLKAIYINGFKSFANKTKLHINSKLTAVVGPNGSGKSNISDAFKWVLGEQSAKTLRGNTMSDVIFAGTKTKKPQSIAQVDLIFDNSDNFLPISYTEVSITRKLYRSGDSEYLINKEKTQLKKIKELFMDTGIGIDGYSIIGQGRIDEIISKNTETKRKILEEAAGIVKYKSRKEETEKKLSNTNDNLDRINDIIIEIENRLKPLKKQKEDAEKYKSIKKELENIEINLLAQEYKKYTQYKEDLIEEQKKATQELNDIEIKRNYKETKLETNIEEINKLDEEIIDYEKDLNQLEKNLNSNKNNIEIEKEKEKLYNEKIESLFIELKEYEEKINSLHIEKTEIVDAIEDEKDKIAVDSKKIEILNKEVEEIKLNLDSKGNYIKDSKSKIFEYYEKISENKNKINKIKTQIDLENQKKEDSSETLDKLSAYKERLNKTLENDQKTLLNLKEDIKRIENKINKTKVLKEEETEKLKKLQFQVNKIENNISRYNNLIKIKSRIMESYDGFYKSIQEFMAYIKKDKFKNMVEGLVVELLKTDKKYTEAISTALGASAQNIIIEKEIFSKEIINFLKEKKIGRITFLPMDTIRERNLNQYQKNALNIDGCIGTADSLIDYDPRYKNIFKFLLGRTIITKNIDIGIKVAKSINYSTNIVTLDGEIIYSGGAITGGSKKHANNLIGREEEILNYKKEKELLLKKRNNIEKDINKTNENKKDIYQLLSSLIENLNKKNKEKEKIDLNMNNRQEELISKTKEKESLELKISNNEEIIDKLEEDLALEKNKLGKIENNTKEFENKIKSNDINFEKEKIEESKIIEEVNNLRIELSKKDNQLNIKKERYKQICLSIDEISEQINKKEEDRDLNLNLVNSSKNKINNFEILIDEENKKSSFKRQTFVKIKEKRKDIQKEIYQNQSLINSLNKEINNIQKDMNSLDIKVERYANKLSNVRERLWKDYEVNYAIAKKSIDEEFSIHFLKKKTDTLKNSIKKLGDVNLSSIEDYKKEKERYIFLSSQRKDLIEAKDELESIIDNLTNKMRVIFLEEYEKINETFKDVFIDLFSGGDAKIILSDINKPLTCDIEIYAQPPGKNLNKISLLSGGEKALTAISLLFSILRVKPTPFCILDEIEAALDDANVYRFANYLKKFSQNTQFLIITHRKGTMEFVDTLYGTTMEEEGITKIISMNLLDLLEKEYVNE